MHITPPPLSAGHRQESHPAVWESGVVSVQLGRPKSSHRIESPTSQFDTNGSTSVSHVIDIGAMDIDQTLPASPKEASTPRLDDSISAQREYHLETLNLYRSLWSCHCNWVPDRSFIVRARRRLNLLPMKKPLGVTQSGLEPDVMPRHLDGAGTRPREGTKSQQFAADDASRPHAPVLRCAPFLAATCARQ